MARVAIVRMISRDVEEFRAFQTRNTEVGRIRIGQFVTPEGKRGRPVKLDRFRLTSPTENHIRVAATRYGGTPQLYQPQGGGAQQWEVITKADALDVWIVNRQNIDPVYEMWGAGRTCTRRCDGEWNTVLQEPCLCNDPERRPADPRQLCKITTRVNVMLPKVAGLHSWRFETHSENAAVEMAAPSVAGVVRIAPVPVPSTLRLRREQRRERNHEKGTFESKDFYVPWFDLSQIGAQALAGGEEALMEALTGAGAPELLADQRAIGTAPVSVVPAPGPQPGSPTGQPPLAPDQGIGDELRAKILQDIEGRSTVEALMEVKAKLQDRGITDAAVRAAWRSKLNAIEAAAKAVLADAGEPEPEYAVGDTVTVGGVEFTKISDDPFPPMDDSPLARAIRGETPDPDALARDMALTGGRAFFDDELPQYDEAVSRGATHTTIVEAGGPVHWLATDDQARATAQIEAEIAHEMQRAEDEERQAAAAPVEDPWAEAVEGTVVGDDGLPALPPGSYTFNDELPKLMAIAGRRTPPLTTGGVRDVLIAAFSLAKASDATGYQVAQITEAMKRGIL